MNSYLLCISFLLLVTTQQTWASNTCQVTYSETKICCYDDKTKVLQTCLSPSTTTTPFTQLEVSFNKKEDLKTPCPSSLPSGVSYSTFVSLGRRAGVSFCEYRFKNGNITQGIFMQTIDNKDVCVINLFELKQTGEICQLGIYNGWNPLRNWQVSGVVTQQNGGLICSVSEIPTEPQLARPPLPTRAELLNLQ